MLDILFEDNHLLAVNKPAGTATMGVTAETESVLNQAKQYLKQRYNKPGNVFLGVVSRLDSVASGVLVFARTSKAAARLSEQFASRRVEKTYWAIVAGNIEPEGDLVDWVYKDEPRKRMAVAARGVAGAQQAELRYRLLRSIGPDSLVEVELITGRKHQIRLQFAARGHAIRGDKNTAARRVSPLGLPCTPAGLSSSIRRCTNRSRWWLLCRSPGAVWAYRAEFLAMLARSRLRGPVLFGSDCRKFPGTWAPSEVS